MTRISADPRRGKPGADHQEQTVGRVTGRLSSMVVDLDDTDDDLERLAWLDKLVRERPFTCEGWSADE